MKKPLHISLSIGLGLFALTSVSRSEERVKIPQSIQTKMERIIMPELNFRQRTVQEICTFIVAKSRELDPEGVGVNIILMTERKNRRLTMTVRKSSVKRVIELLASSADMDYSVDRNAVIYKTPARARAAAEKKTTTSKKAATPKVKTPQPRQRRFKKLPD